MALQSDGCGKSEELKSQFVTREGSYRLMTLSEYSRPNRVGYTNTQGTCPVRVSIVSFPEPTGNGDRICFNFGKELYVYPYKGVKKAADLNKPLDKRIYKGTNPTCHDFNQVTATSETASLLVGFSGGQIQLIDPVRKEISKLYNEERFIDKTRVTCVRWVPQSPNLFLVSHASGQLYVYNEELGCGAQPPSYQLFKSGEGFNVYTCKAKSTRNPLYRWALGTEASINEFAFSPCGAYLAVAGQDGCLRVFHYDTMETVGLARSYFGGLLCVCWSPDGRYIVTGGEDDLVTVWSLHEKRVVARGQGHRSWVSVVAFDPFNTVADSVSSMDFSGSDDESHRATSWPNQNRHSAVVTTGMCYRFGSVGQDTQLCLWDLTEDLLRLPSKVKGIGGYSGSSSVAGSTNCTANNSTASPDKCNNSAGSNSVSDGNVTPFTLRLPTLGLHKERDQQRRHNSNKGSSKGALAKPKGNSTSEDPLRLIGSSACPRLDECLVLEPLVCKKVAHERLTALCFREDCFVTACQDGYVCTWARPGKVVNQHAVTGSPGGGGGGTVV